MAASKGNQAVAAAVEAAATVNLSSNGHKAAPDTWESNTVPGLVFKLVLVSGYAIMAAAEKFKEPAVPVVWLEEKSRDEANPNHPAYLKAMTDYRMATYMATIDCYVALGTVVLRSPAGLEGPESTDWEERLAVVGVEVPPVTQKYARYLQWVKLFALPGEDEVTSLIRAAQRFNGLVLERDVEAAVEDMKSDEGRESNSEVTIPEESS